MSIQNEQPVDWAGCIAQYQASGQSAAAWCRENNIKVHQLRYRLHRANNKSENGSGTSWLPLLPDEPNRPALLIKVGTAAIEVTLGFDPALLRAVVRALSSL
jgi:hypothetical protein